MTDTVKITKGMQEFIGKIGTIMAKEGRMYRIRFDEPVYVEGVGSVRDDLWDRSGFKKVRASRASRNYFTLVVFENGSWAPQFGDYVRSVVQDERDDYREHDVLLKHMKIIKTADDQTSIDSAVAQLNNVAHPGHLGPCLAVFSYIDLHEKFLAHTAPVIFPADARNAERAAYGRS